MRIVSISNDLFNDCTKPNELLDNTNRRPYVLILKLNYNGKNYDFAIPFRSNIAGSVPNDLVFSLPPTSQTKTGNKAGLHLIKMFPVDKKYFEKFHISPGSAYDLNQKIIQRKIKALIEKCQNYLNRKASGEIIPFSVDIDLVISDLSL